MGITKDEIFQVVKENVLNVLPGLNPDDITVDKSLVDLGANSVDRVEVSMYSMERLKLKIPPTELRGIRNLAELVEVFHLHSNRP